ncbi:phage baseplate assembly protein V [Sinomicrobium kalidii]|uniref:type VI secretion system Vgr family protein n=1 Tax=Sinomicrobium kalidii TaxID=2900738 RepID=UPI001E289F0E|nr:phage baseplate assembly protein V [Sinomicrobium kalidii]UGU17177.1 phage baseplate assembly protein V [Sinomicrobium kalidii]
MALQTDLTIKIGTLSLNTFLRFELTQNIDNHHELTLECREDEIYLQHPELYGNYQKLIGEKILVTMKGTDGMFSVHTGYFKGVVTRVKARNSDEHEGKRLHFKAFSPTILLDNGPESFSFLKKDFIHIVHNTTRLYDSDMLKITTKPVKNQPYPYIVQYNESDYDFLKRMCSRQGEWFYYNGVQLIIGQEDPGEDIELHYGYNLFEFDLEMTLQPTRFKYHGNDLSLGASHYSSTRSLENSINGIAGELIQSSGRVFDKETTVQHNLLVNEGNGQTDMDHYALLNFQKKVANMLFIYGKSENPALRPGTLINVFDENGNTTGRFKIIAASHHCTDTGDYENTFKAVPASVTISPYSSPGNYPNCESQPATVIDNNDPKGLGRVKVQMAWQEENAQTTDWIPLSTPNGGSGKGFHFVPEIGETVMVDFQSGNAEMPYVTGCVQHGNANSGYADPNNNLKAIQSRNGNKIIMDDNSGSMFMSDNGGASSLYDGAGNLYVNANSNVTLNVGDGNAKITMDCSGAVTIEGNTNITLKVNSSKIEITENDITIDSKNVNLKGKEKIDLAGEDIVTISGKTNTVTGDTKTTIDGAEIAVTPTGIVTISGSEVDIN